MDRERIKLDKKVSNKKDLLKIIEEKEIEIENQKIKLQLANEEIEKIEVKNKKYSNKEAIDLAKKKSESIIKNRLNEDEYIISQKTLKFSNNGSKIILEMFFSVYEEISEKRVIEGSDNNGWEYNKRCIC